MATGKLVEVEQDAMRIAAKRFRDDEELRLEKLNDEGVAKTPEQILAEVQRSEPDEPEEVELVDKKAKGDK